MKTFFEGLFIAIAAVVMFSSLIFGIEELGNTGQIPVYCKYAFGISAGFLIVTYQHEKYVRRKNRKRAEADVDRLIEKLKS